MNQSFPTSAAGKRPSLDDLSVLLHGFDAGRRTNWCAVVAYVSRMTACWMGPTAGLAPRVSALARICAWHAGVQHCELADLDFAALLVDLGKLSLQRSLVYRALETHAPHERALFMQHPVAAAALLSDIAALAPAARILRHVYEDFSGGGTPDGLSGQHIPAASRLLRVVLDLEHYRAGAIERRKLSIEEACARLQGRSGSLYDPVAVAAVVAQFSPEHPPVRAFEAHAGAPKRSGSSAHPAP